MQTVEVSTQLDADAERVWTAMQHPTTFRYVCHGLIGIPAPAGRYTDTVDIDAGPLTGVVARAAVWIYRYRQARWRRLARRHLQS